jgi:4-aminobutyrate aminotransferase-like enzyme
MVEALPRAIRDPVVNEAWAWRGREGAASLLRDIAFDFDPDWFGGVRFCLSGSEANDLALSLAQALTGRRGLAARERAYHGASGLSRDVTTQPQWHGGLSWADGHVDRVPRSAPVVELPAPIGERIGPVPPDSAADLEAVRHAPVDLTSSAAVIVDYSQGGIYHSAGHQDGVAERAAGAGAVWIADEVVNGFGRCGRMFSFLASGSRPDIVTLGKGLAGGASPAGAVVISSRIADTIAQASWQSGGTFRAHTLMTAAIQAQLTATRDLDLPGRVAALDPVLESLLRDLASAHPAVRRIDGRGFHWTVELHGPDWRSWDGADQRPTLASVVQAKALEAGVLLSTSGEQTSLFLAPPLIAEEGDLRAMIEGLHVGLKEADVLVPGAM